MDDLIIITHCGLCHSSKFLSFRLVRSPQRLAEERIFPEGFPTCFACGNDTKKIHIQIMDALR